MAVGTVVWPLQFWAVVAANGSNAVTAFGCTGVGFSGTGAGAGVGMVNPKLAFGLGWIGPEVAPAVCDE